MRKTIQYPISASYCAKWGEYEAVREIIANAVDADPDPVVTFRNGRLKVADRGAGFDPRCLMLGEGEEKGAENIGKFREGLKLALLVLAREGKPVRLRAPAFDLLSATMSDVGLGADGLTLELEIYDEPLQGGVTVEVGRLDKAAVIRAVETFDGLSYNGKTVVQVADGCCRAKQKGGGRVYFNRVLCHQSKNLQHDYSFSGSDARFADLKGGMNRDRSELSEYRLVNAVRAYWAGRPIPQFLEAMQHARNGTIEFAALSHNPGYAGSEYEEHVKAALMRALGAPDRDWQAKYVLHTDQDATTVCERYGLTVHRPGSRTSAVTHLLREMLVTDVDAARKLHHECKKLAKRAAQNAGGDRVAIGDAVFVAWTNLTDTERAVMEGAARILYSAGIVGRSHGKSGEPPAVNVLTTSAWDAAPVGVYESSGTPGAEGLYIGIDTPVEDVRLIHPARAAGSGGMSAPSSVPCVIGVLRGLLTPGNEGLVAATLAHELAHARTQAQDGTVKFELELTRMLEKFARLADHNQQGVLDAYEAADPRLWTFPQIRTAFKLRYDSNGRIREACSGFGNVRGDEPWRYLGHYSVEQASAHRQGVLEGHLFVGRDGGSLRRMVAVAYVPPGAPRSLTFGRLGPKSAQPWYAAIVHWCGAKIFSCHGIFVGWRECGLSKAIPELDRMAPLGERQEWTAACTAAAEQEGTDGQRYSVEGAGGADA